jgi:hypothetical protein
MIRYLDRRILAERIVLNGAYNNRVIRHLLLSSDFRMSPNYFKQLHPIIWSMLLNNEPLENLLSHIDPYKLSPVVIAQVGSYLSTYLDMHNVGVSVAFDNALYMLEFDMLDALFKYLKKKYENIDVQSNLVEYALIKDAIEYIEDPEHDEVNMMDKVYHISSFFENEADMLDHLNFCQLLIANIAKKIVMIQESRKEVEQIDNFLKCDLAFDRPHKDCLKILQLLFREFYQNERMPHQDCYMALINVARVIGAHKRKGKEDVWNKIDELLRGVKYE